jgi:DNA primase small subunit
MRELVFDIDMTDYDSIRTCCTGKGICKRCWGFITAAVKVLDSGLRESFGYKHILWVYSGRRGIHCWVSDKEAMQLTDDQRKALMGWLEVVKGGKDMVKKVNVRSNVGLKGKLVAPPSFHPFVQDAFDILRDEFNDLILDDQNCFASPEGWQVLLQLLPDTEHRLQLQEQWEMDPSRKSANKWSDIGTLMKEMSKEERVSLILFIRPLSSFICVGNLQRSTGGDSATVHLSQT